MQNLRRQIQACNKCPLYREIMVLPDIGCGSLNPDIMFIIGGVDKEDLIFEKPFNQISENVLLKSLDAANIAKERCYITSIIKCGTLKDKKNYIDTCSEWLIEEIKELKPKLLFFIGRKTYEIFYKKYGDLKMNTCIEDATLYGIFSRSSLMKGFIERLKVANDICKRYEKG